MNEKSYFEELPELPDKDSLDYIAMLDERYRQLAEINEKKAEKDLTLMKEIMEKLESIGKTEVDRTITRDDGFGNIKESHHTKITRIDLPEMIENLEELKDKYMDKLGKITERNDRLDKRLEEFLGAVHEFTELKPVVEKENDKVVLYVTHGDKSEISYVDIILSRHSTSELEKAPEFLFPYVELLLSRHNSSELQKAPELLFPYVDLKDSPILTGLAIMHPDSDIYVAHNPLKSLKLEDMMKYAREKIWEKYAKRNPEAAERAMKKKKKMGMIIIGEGEMPDISEIMEKLLPDEIARKILERTELTEEKYRNKCQSCEKKDGCSGYSIAKGLYDNGKNTGFDRNKRFDLGHDFGLN
ncbi:hypothetical protein KY317_01635 [Candidatus Woesearchaeota archaeon]|nr:hypothetical protein [Candidatus Woesearchaeota archaeon]